MANPSPPLRRRRRFLRAKEEEGEWRRRRRSLDLPGDFFPRREHRRKEKKRRETILTAGAWGKRKRGGRDPFSSASFAAPYVRRYSKDPLTIHTVQYSSA